MFSLLPRCHGLGEFAHTDLSVLHNPLYGAGTRYQHKQYADGHIDLYVYPIRNWQYHKQKHVTREIESVRRDIELFQKEGEMTELVLDETQTKALTETGGSVIEWFAGGYRLPDGTHMATQTHVFAKDDKFVKIRATFGAFTPVMQEVPGFAESLAHQIVVPEESLFMARLRKQWRDRGDE